MQDTSTYYDCWITLQTALKIDVSNLFYKITLVWLDSSLWVYMYTSPQMKTYTAADSVTLCTYSWDELQLSQLGQTIPSSYFNEAINKCLTMPS